LELIINFGDYDVYISSIRLYNVKNKNIKQIYNPKSQYIIDLWFKKNQSEDYIYNPTLQRWIKVNITIIMGNGSFYVYDVFELEDHQKSWQYNYLNNISFDEPGQYIILAKADLINGTREDEINLENNKIFITIKVEDRPGKEVSDFKIDLAMFLMLSIFILIILIVVFLLFIEITRYSIIKIVTRPRSKRAEKSRLMDNLDEVKDSRMRILTYIKLNPGVSFTELKVQQNLSTSELIYYLEKLKSEKFIITKRKGLGVKFYPTFSEVKRGS
jgi:hypothetical protein